MDTCTNMYSDTRERKNSLPHQFCYDGTLLRQTCESLAATKQKVDIFLFYDHRAGQMLIRDGHVTGSIFAGMIIK